MVGALYKRHGHETEEVNNEMPVQSHTVAVAYELNTFTANESIQKARQVQQLYGYFINVNVSGTSTTDNEFDLHYEEDRENSHLRAESELPKFHRVVPSPEYRYQIIHHANVLQVPIIFVVATKYDILYAAYIEIAEPLKAALTNTLSQITSKYLSWITRYPATIPDFPNIVYGTRMDRSSVQGYVDLVSAFHKKVKEEGILPSATYMKPSVIGIWNTHKGGTHVMSRVLKNAAFQMSSIHPKAHIIWRFVQMAVVNTYFICRMLFCDPDDYNSYRVWRRNSAKALSYKDCIKGIYLKMNSHRISNRNRSFSGNARSASTITQLNNLNRSGIVKDRKHRRIPRPRSKSKAAQELRAMRLDKTVEHQSLLHSRGKKLKEGDVIGRARWCILCRKTEKVNGKPVRKGSQTRYECQVCLVFLCRKKKDGFSRSCWDVWHEDQNLPAIG